MSSPFVPSNFTYGDLPQGGALTPIVVASRAPSNTIDKQYDAGYLWLSSLDKFQIVGSTPVYGNGNLYYQAGNSSGTPNWVLISDASGPIVGIVGTANQITVTNVAGTVTLTIPAVFIAPGSIASTTTMAVGTALSAGTTITAGTSITATLGNITATNGNLALSGAGSKLVIAAAAPTTDSVGTTVAMVGGAVTITSSAITASSKIIYARRLLGTAMGNVSITAQAGGSATLTSDAATETSTFDYLIIN